MISKLQKFTESVTLDVLGVVIVVSASIAMGYHLTVIDGIPIGILSTVGAAFSMMATRLVTKRNNWGNLIGVLTTVNTTIVDYYLGNQAALLTYPVSFFGNIASFWFWRKKGNRTPRKFDNWYLSMRASRQSWPSSSITLALVGIWPMKYGPRIWPNFG